MVNMSGSLKKEQEVNKNVYTRQTSYPDHFHYRSKYLPLKPAEVLIAF